MIVELIHIGRGSDGICSADMTILLRNSDQPVAKAGSHMLMHLFKDRQAMLYLNTATRLFTRDAVVLFVPPCCHVTLRTVPGALAQAPGRRVL